MITIRKTQGTVRPYRSDVELIRETEGRYRADDVNVRSVSIDWIDVYDANGNECIATEADRRCVLASLEVDGDDLPYSMLV